MVSVCKNRPQAGEIAPVPAAQTKMGVIILRLRCIINVKTMTKKITHKKSAKGHKGKKSKKR